MYLIDKEKTAKMLRNYAEDKFSNGEIELANGILKAVNFIENNNIPISYDLDNVVKQLDDETFLTTNDDGETNELSILVIEAKAAIEIVKAGGIN